MTLLPSSSCRKTSSHLRDVSKRSYKNNGRRNFLVLDPKDVVEHFQNSRLCQQDLRFTESIERNTLRNLSNMADARRRYIDLRCNAYMRDVMTVNTQLSDTTMQEKTTTDNRKVDL